MQDFICRHLFIRGKVQGVYYRASAQSAAVANGLTGWVRNRRDGSVEAVVSGPLGAVQAFIEWAYQGPPEARVEDIEIEDADASDLTGFEFRATL
ncbi:MAG: acylphosphatase [Rhodocyclaceae bacterium]|nr:acylphosphatase [Rhodocyclaceae bacterium]